MFICNECGRTFSDYEIVEEYHPYGMGFATEKWAVCPYCDNSDFTEAQECKECGDLFTELKDGLCDACCGVLYGK